MRAWAVLEILMYHYVHSGSCALPYRNVPMPRERMDARSGQPPSAAVPDAALPPHIPVGRV